LDVFVPMFFFIAVWFFT